MKDNLDPHQVVMSREMYDDLMKLATVGEDEWFLDDVRELSRIKWHIRKYNAPLRAERKIELMEEFERVTKAKEKLFSLLDRYTGKEVWQCHPSCKRHYFPTYFKVTLLGRSQTDKQRVVIRYENGGKGHVPVDWIIAELPPGYVFETEGVWGGLATLYVPEED